MATSLWTGHWRGRAPAGDTHRRSREVISPSGGIMRCKFPSRKNGRLVHCERLLELDAAYLFETNHRVASFREQPITITYPDGARLRRYTPDFELTLANGLIVWVEIKPLSSLARAEVQHKVARVAEHMARIQQPFVVLNDTLLRQEPRRTNLQAIYHRASPQPRTVQASEAALRRCSHRLPAGLTDATQALAAAGLEPYSLLLAGALRCDLSAPLTADTLITINREDDDGWFRLSEEFDF
ncbi:MAG TPA: TnsA endonuclease N-terminal domain-containing protein [Ottowia sp.]|nr:TnsA endonuclease N-terminal domain-containing protein [Ottowia sp.]